MSAAFGSPPMAAPGACRATAPSTEPPAALFATASAPTSAQYQGSSAAASAAQALAGVAVPGSPHWDARRRAPSVGSAMIPGAGSAAAPSGPARPAGTPAPAIPTNPLRSVSPVQALTLATQAPQALGAAAPPPTPLGDTPSSATPLSVTPTAATPPLLLVSGLAAMDSSAACASGSAAAPAAGSAIAPGSTPSFHRSISPGVPTCCPTSLYGQSRITSPAPHFAALPPYAAQPPQQMPPCTAAQSLSSQVTPLPGPAAQLLSMAPQMVNLQRFALQTVSLSPGPAVVATGGSATAGAMRAVGDFYGTGMACCGPCVGGTGTGATQTRVAAQRWPSAPPPLPGSVTLDDYPCSGVSSPGPSFTTAPAALPAQGLSGGHVPPMHRRCTAPADVVADALHACPGPTAGQPYFLGVNGCVQSY